MKPMMFRLFMTSWLALAPACGLGVDEKGTPAVKLQRVARSAPGISRPAQGRSYPLRSFPQVGSKEQRRALKARVAYVRKNLMRLQQRVAKTRDRKQKIVLRLQLKVLRARLTHLILIDQALFRRQSRIPFNPRKGFAGLKR